ncbi:MAG: hypothetical protein CMH05_00930 [Marinovum sp.]|nr:hypothetical protein [Marinovum sp.]
MEFRERRGEIRQGRVVGLVVAVTMLIWILAQSLGSYLGLPGRYALLIDFLALVAFLWAIISGILMWRSRRTTRNNK